jgi:hypothetical protein
MIHEEYCPCPRNCGECKYESCICVDRNDCSICRELKRQENNHGIQNKV